MPSFKNGAKLNVPADNPPDTSPCGIQAGSPTIFNLVLIEPGKSFVRVIQSIGRGLRKADDKDAVEVFDIASKCKFSNRHLLKRKKFYESVEYPYTVKKITY